ncbi:2d8cfbfd-1880-43b3-9397-ebc67a6ab6d3 [Thermothielavioides terrestris]|uniref:2d8cfbfd-1880-43b3-9397-ebc67a6ab6d3 n=1 Tax=Thermothielavioides terrestris TaxID=2587410 RepID=A0A3S5CWS7_9PEZI|nr:2d8cfbfd-1880-43b3-9397-ebc67a6ab6d3 [Thermothielavioides terrestris]
MAITIPDEYGYVLLAASSTFIVSFFHSALTSRKRRAAGIKYPITYASPEQAEKDPKAFAFNCAQRAHANFMENHTSALAAMLISGLKYPVYAAGLGAVWSVSRVFYALGYVNKGPQGREAGAAVGALANLTLVGMAVYTGLGAALKW